MPKNLILRQNKKNAKLNFLFEATFILSLFLFLAGVPESRAAVTTYNFVGCGTTCDTSALWWASQDDVDQFLFGGSTANRNSHTEATDAQYDLVESSNNSRWTSADPGAGDEIFVWNEMTINEATSTIAQIDLTWEGFLTGGGASTFSIWVLKTGQAFQTDASWVQVGASQSISGTSDTTMTRSITSNFGDYIGSNGLLTWGVYEDASSQSLNTDYVKADVTYRITTLGDGIDPSNVTVAPGASAIDLDSFTLQTDTGAATVESATVTLSAGSSSGLSLVAITNDAGSLTYCSQSNPSSDTVSLASCGIPVTTTQTQFKIRITPKSHANMPAPPGSTYSVTGQVTAFASSNSQITGTDVDSATVTIDNASPANVTAASGSAGDSQVNLSWTNPVDSDFHSTVVLRRALSAVADTPVEGTAYIVGNTIGASTVACVVASPAASCNDTGLTNGTAYHYKIFSRDNYANYATGVVPTGSPLTPTAVPVTALDNGANPSNSSIAPEASATDLNSFILQTNTGTDTVTAATVTLSAGSSGGLSLVAITNDAGSATYCSQSNPSSDTVSLASCGIPVTTTQTQFKIRITPKSHANMPAPPGSTYSVTGTVTSFTSTNSQSGSDTDSAIVMIDNASPANVTSASGSAGDTQVSLSWTNPADSDFHSVVVLRQASSIITDTPVEGTTYIAGNAIGSATIACVEVSPSNSCVDSGLTNGTAYHYKIFSRDTNANYSATGVVPTGSPFTPAVSDDTTAPAAVSNLAVSLVSNTSVGLTWTAPGDDNNSGTATTYDVRYSISEITAGNFSSATQATGEPAPSVAGSSESFTVTGLSATTLYYFALKTFDEVPNTSVISNVVSTTTIATPDTTAPAAVSDLEVTSVTASAVSLSWTAPGDDDNSGTATVYDLRYSTANITGANFSSATQAGGEPTPSIAGSSESMSVTGLSSATTYYFAMKTSDEVPNTSGISNVVSTTTSAAALGPAVKFVIIDPSDSTVGTSVTVTVQAQRVDDSINTSYQNDVTLVASGSATGEGLVDVINGVGNIQINDSVAETVTISLSDTEGTGLDVSSTQQVIFSAVPAPTPEPQVSQPQGGVSGRIIEVIFSGRAYPNSKIEVLRKDTSDVNAMYLRVPLETQNVSEDGSFNLSLGALVADEYFFALRARDKEGRETRIIPFSVDLKTADKLEVTDILVPPTLGFEKTRIRRGDSMKIVGYSTPGNKTEIKIDDKIVSVVQPKDSGFYSLTTTTAGLSFGNHYVKVRQIDQPGGLSNFSTSGTFQVSQLLVPKADLNKDNNIDVTDWSIFLFRWGFKDEKTRLTIDMNNDGMIDIKDFSIFLGTISL